MVDGYMAQAELVIASDLQQEKEFSAKYQELLYDYDLINKTASEYYGLATQDMPVSYTHLDVYKRQSKRRTYLC